MCDDVVIIGAGITGAMLALKLSAYRLKITVLEKGNDIACGATMANSAIVHTGYDPEDGTLKALLNARGARQYEKICRDFSCAYKVTGAYVAASGSDEEKQLEKLAGRAQKRGIPYEWQSGNEARSRERNLADNITKVLSFPSTAVIYPWEVAIACLETAVNNGVRLFLNSEVKAVDKTPEGYAVNTGDRVFTARYVVNAAGVYADDIARMVNDDPGFVITPRRGEYYVLDQDTNFTEHIVFPLPSAKGKGTLVVPTVYGNTLIGPTAEDITDKDDTGTSAGGLEQVRESVNRIMKNVPLNKTIRTFSGLRASSSARDFIIREDEKNPHFIHAAAIDSPGLASAPAIADYIIDIMRKDLPLTENPAAVMTRKKPVVMKELPREERQALIRKNPAYGRIICRCEEVSEGEIVACIHGPCGARTVKGVKKRVRPGMGRCQGGFCEPRVVAILARELGISPLEVVLDSRASNILEEENR